MERTELDVIKELMEELTDKMQYDKDDFEERLGRKKPSVEVVKIEGKLPGDSSLEEALDEHSMRPKTREDEEEELEEQDSSSDPRRYMRAPLDSERLEEESPEESLKQRLMKLRSK